MRKILLKVLNLAAYWASCYGVGYVLRKIVEWLFGEFLTDEAYAEQHPWKYLLGVFMILACMIGIGAAIIYLPLFKLFNFINDKIDKIDEEKEDEDWD